MTISIDELSIRAHEAEVAELDTKIKRAQALRDPFKRKRTEPGRALPHHGNQSAYTQRTNPSLGGQHS